MSLRRLFSSRRPSADDNASQFSHAPTYRSFPEPTPPPPSYTLEQSDIPPSPPQSSTQYVDPWTPPTQPAQSSRSATETIDDHDDEAPSSSSHERRWSRGTPSVMSGNSEDARYWQNFTTMTPIHGPPTSPIPSSPLHRSVFYRVYSPDGLMQSKQPASLDDPSLGRTYAHFVPPPHTASTLKRHLAVREAIGRDIASSLFLDITASTPLEDTASVSILAESGAGSTPQDPLALVLSESGPSTTIITEVATPPRPTAPIANDYFEPPPATSTKPPNSEPAGAITSAQSRPPRPKGWIRVLANDTYKKPSKGFMSYQRGEILYASAWQELNNYGVTQRMATDMTLQRHGKIVMSFFTILKD